MDFKEMRDIFASNVERVYGFSSEVKMASALIRIDSGLRLYTKARYYPILILFTFKPQNSRFYYITAL